ncbi:MAG: hypothetical protein MUP76_00510 [Acidimicrobiia bacterium]|nr:hypothetical protein [Acidimicrobiia bacterium]
MLTGGSWRSVPLLVATGPWGRLRGLRCAPPGWGVLLRTRSIHTAGMGHPITAVGIDSGGRVRWSGTIAPGGVVFDRAATWVAELPPGAAPPPPGRLLRAVPMLGRCPDL